MAITLFTRREVLAATTTDGPIEIAPRGTLVGTVAVLFSAYVAAAPCYTAISFGKDGQKIPIEAGDTFCGDDLGKDGIYLYRQSIGAGNFRVYIALLTPDMSVQLGAQSLTSPRVTDP